VNGSSNVGGFVGYTFGSAIINNSYWYDDTTDDVDVCIGNNVSHDCNDNVETDEAYFFDHDNAPLSSWSFPPWDSLCHSEGYPSLELEGLGSIASCSGYVVPSGGGGGGGTTGDDVTTHTPSVEEVKEGYKKTVSPTHEIQLEIKGEDHLVTVINITKDNVTLLVEGDGEIVTLLIDETRKIDLESDGFYDLQIFVEDIVFHEEDGHYKADLVVTEIHEKVFVELFDISFSLEERLISNANELIGIVTFESFGNVPTLVDLIYIILDEDGIEVYREIGDVTVTTEEVLRKTFKGLKLLNGKYTFVLGTLYGDGVSDEFRQEFEVSGEERSLLWVWVVVIGGVVVGLIYYKRKSLGKLFGKIRKSIRGN
jgi:hypothetical protein